MEYNEITRKIIGAAIEVHRELGGPGLLEKVYETALCKELERTGLKFKRQLECPIKYKGEDISDRGHPLRIDILVEDLVVVECKATVERNPIFAAQCLTYLRLMKLQLGLVINLGQEKVVDGIERVVNPRVGYLPSLPKLRGTEDQRGGEGELRGTEEQRRKLRGSEVGCTHSDPLSSHAHPRSPIL